MARPKEAQYVPCHCDKCSGKMIDQANWLLHNGRVQSGVSWIVEEIMAMSARIRQREAKGE